MSRAKPRLMTILLLQMLALGAEACTVSATQLNFASINPISGNAYNSTATITVSCPTTTSFSVALSSGAGTYGQRVMSAGTGTLRYSLFLDPAMTLIWGDGTVGTSTWNGTTGSAGASHTVYGHVPYQPSVAPGTYTDIITVTISY